MHLHRDPEPCEHCQDWPPYAHEILNRLLLLEKTMTDTVDSLAASLSDSFTKISADFTTALAAVQVANPAADLTSLHVIAAKFATLAASEDAAVAALPTATPATPTEPTPAPAEPVPAPVDAAPPATTPAPTEPVTAPTAPVADPTPVTPTPEPVAPAAPAPVLYSHVGADLIDPALWTLSSTVAADGSPLYSYTGDPANLVGSSVWIPYVAPTA